MCSTYQRYKMKGNHNWSCYTLTKSLLCSTYQRYKMKGNHNVVLSICFLIFVVFNISKIQNERKSQLSIVPIGIFSCCVQHIKDTKWKEITTIHTKRNRRRKLCSTYQRYKMKGNHNVIDHIRICQLLCSTYQRYKMKGNHNKY